MTTTPTQPAGQNPATQPPATDPGHGNGYCRYGYGNGNGYQGNGSWCCGNGWHH